MFGKFKNESFKKKFEAITQSMISLAFEYANNDKQNVDAIFICCSNEDGFIYFDCFYSIDGTLLERHRINDTGHSYDISDEFQLRFIKLSNKDSKDLIAVFKKYKKNIPTLIKMEYYPKTGQFDCTLDYESHYSHIKNKTPHEVVEEWFKKLTSSL